MSKVLVTESHLNNIAEAIRAKNGAATTYRPGDMAAAIQAIPTGGITPTGTKNITQNGTHDVTQYASAAVAVPNSYGAGDEGKVVSNGALVAQTAHAEVTQNGTIDTTLNNSVTVNVSGGGSGSLVADWDYTQSLIDSIGGKTTVLGNGASRDSAGLKLTGAQQYATLYGSNPLLIPDRTFIFNVAEMDLIGDDQYSYTLITFNTPDGNNGFLYRITNAPTVGWALYMSGTGWSDVVGTPNSKNYFHGKELGFYFGMNDCKIYENNTLAGTHTINWSYNNKANLMIPIAIGNSRAVQNYGQCYNVTISRARIVAGNYYA